MLSLRRFNITSIYMLFMIVMFYFGVFEHKWLLNAMGGHKLNAFALLLGLFAAVVMPQLLRCDYSISKMDKINWLILASCAFGLLSTFYNEEGWDNIRRQTISVSLPLILYLCIFGFRKYRNNENIRITLKVLLLAGVAFSLFIAYIMYATGGDRNLLIEYGQYEDFGFRGDRGIAVRWGVPGRSSTNFGPLLVPLVFVGFYLSKYSRRWGKYFYLCAAGFILFVVFSSISRGAFLAFMGGIIYLCWSGWFGIKRKQGMPILFFLIIVLVLYLSPYIFIRTFATFRHLPILSNLNIFNDAGMALMESKDPRLYNILDTVKYIFDRTLIGYGHTNFITAQMARINDYPHNHYLRILVTSGFPRFVFYVLFLLLLTRMVNKTSHKLAITNPEKDLGMVFVAGLISFLIYLNFASREFTFLWVWFGFAAAWARNCDIAARSINRKMVLA